MSARSTIPSRIFASTFFLTMGAVCALAIEPKKSVAAKSRAKREFMARAFYPTCGGERGEAKSAIDARRRVGKNTWTMAQKLSDKKLAVLGAGKLGGILLRAYLKQGLFSPKRVTATVKHGEKA